MKHWTVATIFVVVGWLLLMLVLFPCARSVHAADASLHDRLLAAIRQVESGGNDRAVGDGGNAIGPYQIHFRYYHDGAEQLRREKQVAPLYLDMFHEPSARRIVLAYWRRYAPAHATDEQLARIHNGGPKGHLKSGTKDYWWKVKKELAK